MRYKVGSKYRVYYWAWNDIARFMGSKKTVFKYDGTKIVSEVIETKKPVSTRRILDLEKKYNVEIMEL